MRTRWYKAKVHLPFFTGECVARKTETCVHIMDTSNAEKARCLSIDLDTYNKGLGNKTIKIRESLELKECKHLDDVFKKAKKLTNDIGPSKDAEEFQSQSRITRPQPETPVEVKIIPVDISTANNWAPGELEQQLGRTKPRQAALLTKPQ